MFGAREGLSDLTMVPLVSKTKVGTPTIMLCIESGGVG